MATDLPAGHCRWCGRALRRPKVPCSSMDETTRRAQTVEQVLDPTCYGQFRIRGY